LKPEFFARLADENAALTPACDALMKANAAERAAIRKHAVRSNEFLRGFAELCATSSSG